MGCRELLYSKKCFEFLSDRFPRFEVRFEVKNSWNARGIFKQETSSVWFVWRGISGFKPFRIISPLRKMCTRTKIVTFIYLFIYLDENKKMYNNSNIKYITNLTIVVDSPMERCNKKKRLNRSIHHRSVPRRAVEYNRTINFLTQNLCNPFANVWKIAVITKLQVEHVDISFRATNRVWCNETGGGGGEKQKSEDASAIIDRWDTRSATQLKRSERGQERLIFLNNRYRLLRVTLRYGSLANKIYRALCYASIEEKQEY